MPKFVKFNFKGDYTFLYILGIFASFGKSEMYGN